MSLTVNESTSKSVFLCVGDGLEHCTQCGPRNGQGCQAGVNKTSCLMQNITLTILPGHI